MIIRATLYITVASAAAFAGYQALVSVYPAGASEISGFVRDRFLGWNEDACSDNPLPCLKNRYGTLEKLEKSVATSVEATRVQKDSLTAIVAEQDETYARNGAYLNEGKALYKLNAGKDNAIIFAGKTYTETAFKQQLGLLFQEKAALAKSLESTKSFEKKLQNKLESLMVQAANITLAKRMIPAQMELVRANNTLSNFGENLDMINGVIKGSEVGLAETEQLIRTTKDLMEPSEAPTAPAASDKDFEKFLAQ